MVKARNTPAAPKTTAPKKTAGTAPAAKPAGTGKKPRNAPNAGNNAGRRNAAPLPPNFVLPTRKQGVPIRVVERHKKDPTAPKTFWERFRQNPLETMANFNWNATLIDEAFALFIGSVGLVSLFTLLSASNVELVTPADQWADLLSQIFGRIGAVLLSVGMIGGAALIILPKIGVNIRISWRQLLAVEVGYVALLALLHLFAHDPEPRALARAGLGGGYVGWALSLIMSSLFGSALATLLYLIILAISFAALFGVRRKHVRAWLVALKSASESASATLQKWAAAAPRPARAPEAPRSPQAVPLAENPANPALPPDAMPGMLGLPAQSGQPAQHAPQLGGVASAPPGPTLIAPRVAPTPRVAPPAPNPGAAASTSVSAPRPGTPKPQPTAVPPLRNVGKAPTPDELDSDQDGEMTAPPLPSSPTIIPSFAASAPPAPPSVPTVQPVMPERRRRVFRVEDFSEVRKAIPRPDLPPITLLGDTELDKPTEQEVNTNARIIEDTLLEFDIDVEVVDVRVGPTVTQYAVQPFREVTDEQGQVTMQRVRVARVASLAGDLALALAAKRLRIQPYVPGFTYMGIEVPNRKPSVVALRPVMESEAFYKAYVRSDPDQPGQTRTMPLVVPLGRDVSGEAVAVDLATMPHVLVAGTTGSGKSVCITALTVSLLMNNMPDRVKLILLDPKMVELTRFNGLPHLLGPVETDTERILGVLRWATREMDLRYKMLEAEGARNIEAHNRALNARGAPGALPYIVILVDEIGDLMLARPEEMERQITRLAQMARAVGIHLVIATQRPSTDVITGLIKANFPARISFAVASNVDSRVILDQPGAETLMGRGDMLYVAPDAAVPRRVQGCFVSDDEIDEVVAWWKNWQAQREAAGGERLESAPWDRGVTRRESLNKSDPLMEDAIDIAVNAGEASVILIQRQLNIPYPHAAHLMDGLRELGVLGARKEDGRSYEVTLKPGSDPYKKLIAKYRREMGS